MDILEFIATAFIAPTIGVIIPIAIKSIHKRIKLNKNSKSSNYGQNSDIEISETVKSFKLSIVFGSILMLIAVIIEAFFQNIVIVENITTDFISIVAITFAFMSFSVSFIAFKEALRYRGE